MLVDINPNNNSDTYYFYSPGPGAPSELTVLNDKLYFSADDGVNDRELWVSDGTAEGTQLFADINPTDSSRPGDFTEFNDKLYFSADDGVNGRELWVSNGTTEGTQLLIDIEPGINERYGVPASSAPSNFVEFNDKLLFSASGDGTDNGLWVTDGTTEGTQVLADLPLPSERGSIGPSLRPEEFTEFDDKLYFTVVNKENGISLWTTDGTTVGTQLVADIIPERPTNFYRDYANLTVAGNELFFTADNGETGEELFKLTAEDLTDGMPIAIDGSDASDNLLGGDNAEQINALSGQDTVDSGAGNDTVDGGDGDDRLISLSGNNSLVGGNGNDTIESGDGNDTLDGGNGDDRLSSLAGDDLLIGGNGNDTLHAGEGHDTLTGDNGSDILNGGGGSDSLSGGEDNDFLDGGADHDTLTGDNGDDRLLGGADNDLLIGGASNDFLDGGAGHDTLQGDGGDDVFVLRTGTGTDTILDFNLGGDRLGLSDGLQFGDLSFSGHAILAGEEVLATLNGVDTTHLSASDFTPV